MNILKKMQKTKELIRMILAYKNRPEDRAGIRKRIRMFLNQNPWLKSELVSMAKAFGISEGVRIYSIWDLEIFRNGRMVDASYGHGNLVVNEGLDGILGIMFSDDTQITDWYILLFESDTTPAAGTTYASPGWTEWTAYDEANRQAWVEPGVSSQSITNSASKASFTANATKTIYGGALVGGGTDPATKGDTAGGSIIYSASKFASSKGVEDDEVLKITCTLTAEDAST